MSDMSMAWRDLVSSQELEWFFRDSVPLLTDWLDTVHPSIVEEYLDQYNETFLEFLKYDLGKGVEA